jgi:Fe-S-cluster containining protein
MSVEPERVRRRDTDDAPFSYACNRCLRCCHDKLIQVNPYEAARLARRLGLSTTRFIAEHLEDGVYLRRVEAGACGFLGPEGCTVHPDRPLVCRLYPIGRHVGSDGAITYSHQTPHPETAGIYGQAGTIHDFLAQQDVGAFVSAADRYLAILQRLYDTWRAAPIPDESEETASEHDLDSPMALLDLDWSVARHCVARGISEPVDIEERMNLHLEAIAAWLDNELGGHPPK